MRREAALAKRQATLAAVDATLAERNEAIATLSKELAELAERVAHNSSNSHLPPSRDGPGAGTRTAGRRDSSRKRGGQKGAREANGAIWAHTKRRR